jgi:hypothetical protein
MQIIHKIRTNHFIEYLKWPNEKRKVSQNKISILLDIMGILSHSDINIKLYCQNHWNISFDFISVEHFEGEKSFTTEYLCSYNFFQFFISEQLKYDYWQFLGEEFFEVSGVMRIIAMKNNILIWVIRREFVYLVHEHSQEISKFQLFMTQPPFPSKLYLESFATEGD